MMKGFDHGLVFLKSEDLGKCFIEYIPAENAWIPIIAHNYMYIDCFWGISFIQRTRLFK